MLRSSAQELRPIEIKSAVTWRDALAPNVRAFVRDMPFAFEPTIGYDGDDLELSTGISVHNVRSFHI